MDKEPPKTYWRWWQFLLYSLWPFLAWLGLLLVTAAVGSRTDPPGGEDNTGMLLTMLLLALCAAAWSACCIWTFVQALERLRPPWAKPVSVLLLVVLIPLPQLDELLCAPQFDGVCRSLKTEITDLPDTQGRFHDAAKREMVMRKRCLLPWMRITVKRERLLAHATGEVLASREWARYQGGWLVRILSRDGADSANLYQHGFCYSKYDDLEKQLRQLGVREYTEPLPQKPVSPSDETMLEHFQANRAAFEELVRYYRTRLFVGREYTRQDYPFKQREGVPLEPGDADMDALMRRVGVARVEVDRDAWLPDPYDQEAAQREDARIWKCRDEAADWRERDRCWYTGPEHASLTLFPEDSGDYKKSWLHFPVVPKIERGVLLGPVSKAGTSWYENFVLDSLNLTPSHWQEGECVYRAIDSQWFLCMCRPRKR